jgi:hypothetical protein
MPKIEVAVRQTAVSVTKQLPKDQVRKPSANGSMLARAVPVAELDWSEWYSVLIYGTNRVGKTTLACQFEKPVALVSFEPSPFTGGAVSVKKMAGVDHFLVIPSTAEERWPKGRQLPVVGTMGAVQLAEELMEDERYKTVVLDGGTSLQDVALCELMDLPELPAQMKVARSKDDRSWGVATSDNYMDRSAKAKEVLRKFLNLRKHRVILCKERDHNPPRDEKGNVRRDKLTRGLTLESFVAADLGQATAGWLMDACDCVCRLYLAEEIKTEEYLVAGVKTMQEVGTGKMVRRLLTQLHTNFAAGVRSASPDNVPEFVEGRTPQELHRRLMQVLRGEKVT